MLFALLMFVFSVPNWAIAQTVPFGSLILNQDFYFIPVDYWRRLAPLPPLLRWTCVQPEVSLACSVPAYPRNMLDRLQDITGHSGLVPDGFPALNHQTTSLSRIHARLVHPEFRYKTSVFSEAPLPLFPAVGNFTFLQTFNEQDLDITHTYPNLNRSILQLFVRNISIHYFDHYFFDSGFWRYLFIRGYGPYSYEQVDHDTLLNDAWQAWARLSQQGASNCDQAQLRVQWHDEINLDDPPECARMAIVAFGGGWAGVAGGFALCRLGDGVPARNAYATSCMPVAYTSTSGVRYVLSVFGPMVADGVGGGDEEPGRIQIACSRDGATDLRQLSIDVARGLEGARLSLTVPQNTVFSSPRRLVRAFREGGHDASFNRFMFLSISADVVGAITNNTAPDPEIYINISARASRSNAANFDTYPPVDRNLANTISQRVIDSMKSGRFNCQVYG
ncbi:hypothetical protein [Humitalea rosea]|nr:hypothetical protein [Humitalea rosea]